MPGVKRDQPLLPSILDRLIDTEPELTKEPPRSRTQTIRELKQAVRRDLQNLLNTRVRCVPPPEDLKELEVSLVNYGIPDMTGVGFASNKERELFRRRIQNVIAQYEKRLKKLNVQLVDAPDPLERSIHFHIEAMLQAEPTPEPIQLDSTLRLATGTFEVEGEHGG
jgi:type VI secretion system protein ImpF